MGLDEPMKGTKLSKSVMSKSVFCLDAAKLAEGKIENSVKKQTIKEVIILRSVHDKIS